MFSQCDFILLSFFLMSQVYWFFSPFWYFTSLCWPYCPVTTPYLYTMSCPGLWPVWAQLEPFLFSEVSSSLSSPFLSAPGRNVCHTKIVLPSTWMLNYAYNTVFVESKCRIKANFLKTATLSLLLAFCLSKKSYNVLMKHTKNNPNTRSSPELV